jgi:hypothetical protein
MSFIFIQLGIGLAVALCPGLTVKRQRKDAAIELSRLKQYLSCFRCFTPSAST